MVLDVISLIEEGNKNFVFIGGVGSGKTEISINFAMLIAEHKDFYVHYFDLDMTKPLFRSRDLEKLFHENNITLHYQEQFFDAPTIVGGIRSTLNAANKITILDVGGDHVGARSIGRIQDILNRDDTVIFYVLNSFRPWTDSIDSIDETFAHIVKVSHINSQKIRIVTNPNLGDATSVEDFLQGQNALKEQLSPYKEIAFSCIMEELYTFLDDKTNIIPLRIHLRIDSLFE